MTSVMSGTRRNASLISDVNEAVLEAHRNEGYTLDKDGEEKLSNVKLAEAVRDLPQRFIRSRLDLLAVEGEFNGFFRSVDLGHGCSFYHQA